MNSFYNPESYRHVIGRISAIILFIIGLNGLGAAQQRETMTVSGTVFSHRFGAPLGGATVKSLPSGNAVKTDSLGSFLLTVPSGEGTLEISYIGYKTVLREYTAQHQGPLRIVLVESENTIDEVVVNTGYQHIPRERATGSFDVIDNELINRSVSADLLTRLENLSPGLLFNRGDAADTDPFLIRGRSTITAEARPLIVLNDFPYDGDLNNINPNDIESVSVLKDAAAASIWGARAGNGVIVITTKRGTTTMPRIEVASNVTSQGRPDLFNVSQLSSAERIELERYLFENGRYDGFINPATLQSKTNPIPQAVELMIANPNDLESRLAQLATRDVRDDLADYFYRTSTNQQYNLNVSGSQDRIAYYMSGGFDRNLSNLVGETYNRVSLRSGNTFKVNDRLKIEATINFFWVNEVSGDNSGYYTSASAASSLSPYTKLVDDENNALPVYLSKRKGYVDTVDNGRLLDWNYRPYDEIDNERHTTDTRDYLVNVGSTYQLLEGVELQVKYQFQNQLRKSEALYREQSYYARNLINDYTQINPLTGLASYPFPVGGILQVDNVETLSHQGRGQLNFNRAWNGKHTIIALAGFEIRQLTTTSDVNQNFGYNEDTGVINTNVDTETYYPRISVPGASRIFRYAHTGELKDNFVSYFSNAAYTYGNRYTVSASFRKDEANLFGLNANQKGTPLWSVGGAWELSNEPFYGVSWLPFLKARASYGINGNISRSAHALSTISLVNSGYSHASPRATIGSAPNRELSWEKIKQLNIGVDFATSNKRLSGTIEYYDKNATNLLAQTPVDPTYGVTSMYMNVADMRGKGVDIQINSININRAFQWQTVWIFSHSSSKVTNYLMPVATTGRTYLPVSLVNPLLGKPLYSVFALAWEGLDPATGDPIGLVNGERSMDYNTIYNNTTLDELVFFGTAQPTNFGAVRNTFSYRNINLSFNISYKFGYYFRRSSIDYTSLVDNDWKGHGDYANRWQQPGDELTTDIPSFLYPSVPNRDVFYRYSSTLVEKGDHIRLEDVNVSYNIIPTRASSPLKSIRLFAYVSNIGVLWKANDWRIDPYYNNVPLQQPRFSLGMNLTL
ncbi:SusC/RagA family TonB-linked outer membrane protein [Parapedobacter tibetensis]|uniref:SusC/RagA family TonB-linked outer membrane protein n=1 Tax=Parapedobacter tibetensis TaxID=2972951 RepID=UPI00214DD095|nr:SusC/RagA family TonB-linked outer membrane protein [Parapedobacter tibetensis]